MLEEPTRIDVHHHWFPDAWLEVARRDRSTPSLPGGWSADADLATMDALGIQAAVLSITAPGIFVGDGRDAAGIARRVNDEGAQMVATPPDR